MQLFKKALHRGCRAFFPENQEKAGMQDNGFGRFVRCPSQLRKASLMVTPKSRAMARRSSVLDGLANQAAAHGQCRFVKHLVQREIQRKQQVFLSERARQEGA